MRTGIKMAAVLLTIGIFISAIIPAYANDLQENREKLQQVTDEMKQKQDNINTAKQQEKNILSELEKLDRDINTTQQEIDNLAGNISSLQTDINKTEENIEAREEELDKQIEYLSNRLVHMYEGGMNTSYMEVLFSATDIRDFLTRYDYLKCIVDRDNEIIESINKTKRDLEVKKADLDMQKRELMSKKSTREARKNQLSVQRGQRDKMLGNVQQQKEELEKALNELEQQSKEIEAMIRAAQSGTALGTGVYTWPTPGYSNISSPYGMRYHPILKYNKLHTGVDIVAPGGANIVAADTGTVMFAGWMNGYGQVIILQHSSEVSTLYAHQSRFLVSQGEVVTRGQAIGKVGSTGWSTGPHLHFEVRINGQPTNPIGYI